MISVWENRVLFTGKAEKGFFNDLRHVLAVFRLWWTPKHPQGSPEVPNRRSSAPWKFERKYVTTGWFHYGKGKCYSIERRTNKYMINLGMFWASSGLRCPLKDPPGSPMVPNRHPSVLLDFWMKYSSMGWFDYGKTGPCLHGRWSKVYLLIQRIFQALWVPNRPPRVSKGFQWTT